MLIDSVLATTEPIETAFSFGLFRPVGGRERERERERDERE